MNIVKKYHDKRKADVHQEKLEVEVTQRHQRTVAFSLELGHHPTVHKRCTLMEDLTLYILTD